MGNDVDGIKRTSPLSDNKKAAPGHYEAAFLTLGVGIVPNNKTAHLAAIAHTCYYAMVGMARGQSTQRSVSAENGGLQERLPIIQYDKEVGVSPRDFGPRQINGRGVYHLAIDRRGCGKGANCGLLLLTLGSGADRLERSEQERNEEELQGKEEVFHKKEN